MIIKRLLSFAMISIIVISQVSCQQTPQNVKERYNSGKNNSITRAENDSFNLNAERINISQINSYNEKLYEYIKQKEYDKRFIIPKDLRINSATELFSFNLKQTENTHMQFPQIYDYCFGRNFKLDSGAESVDKLRHASPEEKLSGFYFDDVSVVERVRYLDTNTFNSQTGSSQTSLDVGKTGFIYYKNNYNYFDDYTCCKQVFYSKGETDNEKLKMSDDSLYSSDEAKQFAQEYINKMFGYINSDFEYKVGHIKISENEQGKHVFTLVFQKEYKGIAMTDFFIGSYPSPIYTKAMYYDCVVSGKEKIAMVGAPFGFEELKSKVQIKDKIIPVTKAVDILNEKLAEHITLNISDIKLMYYNEYDAKDHKQVEELNDQYGGDFNKLSKEQQQLLMNPEKMPYREYKCYPVWVFYVQKDVKPNKYGISKAMLYDYIIVNAQTGEMIDYIDRGSTY